MELSGFRYVTRFSSGCRMMLTSASNCWCLLRNVSGRWRLEWRSFLVVTLPRWQASARQYALAVWRIWWYVVFAIFQRCSWLLVVLSVLDFTELAVHGLPGMRVSIFCVFWLDSWFLLMAKAKYPEAYINNWIFSICFCVSHFLVEKEVAGS